MKQSLAGVRRAIRPATPPHAMAPNVAGVIGSVVAAGIMMSFLM